jgi:uncharacterized protein Usg
MEKPRLATAEIIYFLPDFPSILQSYVWQFSDVSPNFPRLMKFLTYWETTLEGRIYSVQISHAGLSEPAALRNACGFWTF